MRTFRWKHVALFPAVAALAACAWVFAAQFGSPDRDKSAGIAPDTSSAQDTSSASDTPSVRGTSLQAAPSQTGVLQGAVIYEPDRKRPWRYARYYVKDRKTGLLAEAVVALRSGKLDGPRLTEQSKPAASRLYVIGQKDYRFIPETIAIRAGDRVKFTNADAVVHNVFSNSPTHRFDVNLRKGSDNVQRFEKAGGADNPVTLRCAFHSTMQAWIFVFDHSFFQVTGTNGRFRLADVPAGNYELVVLHASGELRTERPVKIAAGQTSRLDIRVSPDDKVESKQR